MSLFKLTRRRDGGEHGLRAPNRRHVVLGSAAVTLSLLAAGCSGGGFQPLHGVSASGGDLSTTLASVNVATIPGRVGQQLRNELIFKMRGGEEAYGADYRLQIAIRESVRNTLVQLDGDAEGRVYLLTSEFKLISNTDNAVLLEGKNHSQAAYQRNDSVYANLRARRDAENRAAKDSAQMIATRVSAFLSRAT